MTYPINDIFEGTRDLLIKHGKLELSVCDGEEEVSYINYGGYFYRITTNSGNVVNINRIKITSVYGKEQNNVAGI